MKIEFADSAEGEFCNDYNPQNANDKLNKYIKKKSNNECNATDVMRVLGVLKSANNPSEIPSMYNYHLLKYDLSGSASVNIISRGRGKKGGRGRWRIILKPISSCGDINNDNSVKELIVLRVITDYHKRKR